MNSEEAYLFLKKYLQLNRTDTMVNEAIKTLLYGYKASLDNNLELKKEIEEYKSKLHRHNYLWNIDRDDELFD